MEALFTGEPNSVDITELLTFCVKNNASDLHLSSGLPPSIRVDGDIRRIQTDVLDSDAVLLLVNSIMSEKQRKLFEQDWESDFSIELKGLGRFRVNVFHQNRGPAAVFRHIPSEILSLDQLGVPAVTKELLKQKSGIVLVTGATGSGKSTTLAAMVDYINSTRKEHVITIEDPIEFVHETKQCLINQRELNKHTKSYNNALKAALREDPDVILVGELRDLDTIRLAITAAETGHLVLATLHTSSAPKTIDRLIDVFPAGEKPMIRSMLSESIRAVVSQTLMKKIGGGRIASFELMIGTPAIRNLIREDKIPQMYSVMQMGASVGMQTMEQSQQHLVRINAVHASEIVQTL